MFDVRHDPHVLIPLDDGTELAASVYFPDAPGSFPVVMTCLPYHKDELFGTFIDPPNRYFAARGYAAVVVDLRGTGASTGRAHQAFAQAPERVDCAEAVEWIAQQAWCNGNVGMWGISYGGITALATATLQPPHLKAIAPVVGGCPDQYLDWFAPGGCPKFLRPHLWATTQLAHQLSPPMHHDPEGRWYRVWRDRLDDARDPWILPWHDHQTQDAFWADKVSEIERIKVPTFLIGGWRDIFAEGNMRTFERIDAPRRLLMGPWLHGFPAAFPNAPVDHLAEICRWWDEWLGDKTTGVRDEPRVTLYVQGSGFWAQEPDWPPAKAAETTLFLDKDGLLDVNSPQREASVVYRADPTVGVTAGDNNPGGDPLDQGADDMRSLLFETAPLAQPLMIAGSSEAVLHLAIEDASEANLVVRLCDVAPDGTSTLIATGWLKASHRLSHTEPEPVEPGRVYEFRVPIWATAWEVVAGHRLRLAFSCADFPRIWPTTENPNVRVQVGGTQASCVRIPTATLSRATVDPPLPASLPAPAPRGAGPERVVRRDTGRDEVTFEYHTRGLSATPEGDRLEIESGATAIIEAAQPGNARSMNFSKMWFSLPSGGNAFVETRSHVTRHGVMVSGRVERDGQLIFEKQWRG